MTMVQILRRWAELGRNQQSCCHFQQPEWAPAHRMALTAQRLFEVEAQRLQLLLEESRRRLEPFGDPLTTDFGMHRWLSCDREEAYSDWLQWIIQQIHTPQDIFWLLHVPEPAGINNWRLDSRQVEREFWVPEGHTDQTGRLDLVVHYESRAVIVIEVKTTSVEDADTQKQRGYLR